MIRTTSVRRHLVAFTAALAVPAAAPALASATGSATLSSGTMTVTAGTGDVDYLSIMTGDVIGGNLQLAALNNNPVTGAQIGVTPGTGCVAYLTIFAQCPKPSITSIVVNAGDQNDRITSNQDATTLNGGTGDDWIVTEPDQALQNTYNGGSGSDTVSYNGGSVAISATVDGVRNDGYLGRANIATDVERVIGSTANDTLTGSSATRTTLMGQNGNDTLTAGAAGANLYGGRGNDTLNGGTGADQFTDMVGTDTMIGGGGDDTFYAEDSDNADHITCGAGYDVAFVDGPSEITDSSCEQVVIN